MKLSVILPCYNGAATLAVQLEALCRQHWPNGWELIVANNGSTDGSMAIVERYRERLPALKIVQAHVPGTPRFGVPHSYNVGIQAATGDAFVFCEADDEVAPGWLAAMGEALARHDFVAARLDHRKLNPEWLHPLQGEGYQSERLSQMRGYPYLAHASGCSFGLRRAVYERVGPLDSHFPCVHDTEYSWRAQLAGYSLHLEPRALVHYREKAGPLARFRQGRAWGRDYVRLLQYYGVPAQGLELPRKLLAAGRLLPEGLPAWLASARGEPNGRHGLAQWFWNMGWSVGELMAVMRDPVVPRSNVLAVAAAIAAASRAGAAAEPREQRLRGSS
ncbi:glycosyltransferase family 2 protein [Ramlibacter tataouinensis]|uniref:Candidate b-glycosyltransferase, Glycosyltransferase Family 2 n=1 Tax=Ramlibacter tataouinensis (strain ATCC BAA-407 / DSM 14655 / LMG 21543 / TTB310) TaxID=365046 RepID=F5XY11_RAMTT|nr:glycosyltransferase family A protein [Ramlibacter tataouinensis]AEG94336.1 candidate b-glycosyltransferase, Glycosyltransferase Family 2 [Ramlibacter tataouinensis TTB310]